MIHYVQAYLWEKFLSYSKLGRKLVSTFNDGRNVIQISFGIVEDAFKNKSAISSVISQN